MTLNEIVSGLKIKKVSGDISIEITDIAYDSRKVTANSLFVCIEGVIDDGHKYIDHAIENGAKALLVQKDIFPIEGVTIVKINNTRYGLAHVSDRFFKSPSKNIPIYGITGTKGKTSTVYMLKAILDKSGQKNGLICTNQNMIGDKVLFTERTTPESYDLQKMLREMVDKSINSCVMEVSSQGLALHRVALCNFEIGIFTNLSRDHIGHGEHKDMDDYAKAKAKLFKMCKKGLVNIDSEYAPVIMRDATCEIYTYGIQKDGMSKKPDFMAKNIRKEVDGVSFIVDSTFGEFDFFVSMPGYFSVYNSLAAIGAAFLAGMEPEVIKEALSDVKVPGRAEPVPTGRDFSIIIDYAHNPDSFINILTTVKEYAKGRVVFLFGCGGDKQRPRELMGETAGKYADFAIITSDNPRTEDPLSIIKDLEKGMKKTDCEYVCIVDRKEAIRYAIENAKCGDVIILAGKGHETYQIFKDKTIHFDEREIVRDILKELSEQKNER